MRYRKNGLLRQGAAWIVMAALTAMAVTGCGTSGEKEILLAETEAYPASSGGQTEDAEETESEEKSLIVHVCGAVADPGVYALPEGSRVMDAVQLAGGMTAEADAERLNLASVIEDGQQIRIPYQDEAPEAGEDSPPRDTRVNINTAPLEELMTLPGIGESRAGDIMAYREKHRFDKPADIMNVPGIKEGAFRKLEDRIRTE